jgi:hypothetical protein
VGRFDVPSLVEDTQVSAYWFVYLAPLLGLLSPVRAAVRLRTLLWVFLGAGLIAFVGLRHEVGMDWPAYLAHFNVQVAADGPVWINEPAFVVLSWVLAHLGFGIYAVNLFCAAVFLVGLLTFVSRQPFRWLALTVAVPYLIIIVGMNNTRQSVALGLLFLALLALEHGRIKRFGALIIVGAMFHASALACLAFGALKVRRPYMRQFVIVVAVGVAAGVTYLTQLYEYYARSYGADTQLQSSGAGIRLAINVVAFATMLALRRSWKERFGWDRLWFWMGMVSLLLLPVVPFASTAIDRMSLYLMPLQIYVWGHAPVLIATPLWRTVMVAGLVVFYGAVLYIWLVYATNSIAWFPYQNVMMGVPD